MARKNPIFKIKKKNRRALDDIKNYLNINFYEKILKIGFYLAKNGTPKLLTSTVYAGGILIAFQGI